MKLAKSILVLLFIGFASYISYAGNLISLKQGLNTKNLNFVINKGQLVDEKGKLINDVKYYLQYGGAKIYCRPGMISFAFTKKESPEYKKISEATGQKLPYPGVQFLKQQLRYQSKKDQTSIEFVNLIFLNANIHSAIIDSDQQPYYENFYTKRKQKSGDGSTDSDFINISTYKTVTYKEIYPHIDLVLHALENGLKYEFIVYPGGNVSDIKLQWKGLVDIKKLKDSKIEYSLATGKITESAPFSYQINPESNVNKLSNVQTGTKQIAYNHTGEFENQGINTIESQFIINDNDIAFKTGKYDTAKTLIIDPTLLWGTYFGGNSDDESHSVATDLLGNIFITGHTGSTSYIATQGAYKTYFGGLDNDADDTLGLEDGDDFGGFLSKFDPKGNLLWSTYFNADCYHVATDNQGNAYITGRASPEIQASKGAYQTVAGSTFLARFNGNGQLAWATYYGDKIDSAGYIIAYSVATDDSSNVFIAGTFNTHENLISPNHYMADSSGFLAKFSNNGTFRWATTIGKRALFGNAAVATDHFGHIYITMATSDTVGIATTGVYQTSFAGGVYRKGTFGGTTVYATDVVLAQYNGAGKLNWATYFGGPDNEISAGVATDRYGNVYLTGNTHSYTGIATSGAYQVTNQGNDAFLARFTGSGNLVWATYFGGSFTTSSNAVTIDGSNNAYISGYTTCPSGIATSNAYQLHIKGGENAFIAEFNPLGAVQWATYFGGTGNDNSLDITTNKKANIYITGLTNSHGGIATSGAYQTGFRSGGNDAFLVDFFNRSDIIDVGIDSILSPNNSTCKDSVPVLVKLRNNGPNNLDSVKIIITINLKIQKQYSWKGNLKPDSTINVNLGKIFFATGIDTLKIWTTSPNGGLDSFPGNDTISKIINSYPLPVANAGPDTILCYNQSYTMQGSGGATYFWQPANYLSSATDPNAKAMLPNTERYTLLVTNTHGCRDSSTIVLTVRPKLQVKCNVDTVICYNSFLLLQAKGSGGLSAQYHYTWPYDNNNTSDSIRVPQIKSGWHKVILTDNCSAAPASDSVYVKVLPPAKAIFSWIPDSPLVAESVIFNNQSLNALAWLWIFGNKDSSSRKFPGYTYHSTGEYLVELIAYGLNHCPNDTEFGMVNVINRFLSIYIPNSFSPNGDGINDYFELKGVGIKSYTCNIYNRWGEQVFTGTGPWDGRFKKCSGTGRSIYLSI